MNQGDNKLVERAKHTYNLEAVVGSGSPWAWSGAYLAVAIGDWISIETAAESGGSLNIVIDKFSETQAEIITGRIIKQGRYRW